MMRPSSCWHSAFVLVTALFFSHILAAGAYVEDMPWLKDAKVVNISNGHELMFHARGSGEAVLMRLPPGKIVSLNNVPSPVPVNASIFSSGVTGLM